MPRAGYGRGPIPRQDGRHRPVFPARPRRAPARSRAPPPRGRSRRGMRRGPGERRRGSARRASRGPGPRRRGPRPPAGAVGDCQQRRIAALRVEPERGDPARDLTLVEPVVLEILEQVAGETELGGRHGVSPRELEGERGLAVVEHEAVVLGELVARLPGPQRPGLAVGDDRQLEHVLTAVEARAVALADDTAGLVDEREAQPTWSPRIASSAGVPWPSRTETASRSCTSSARSRRASCAFASRDAIAFVSAMNGTSYGTVTSGKSSSSASSASAAGGSAQPKPIPNASPARPWPARRRTYSRCGRDSSPMPRPVVISSSPPSSHGVGSGSSDTCTQRIAFRHPAPAASSSSRPGRFAISRTVSMGLGRAAKTLPLRARRSKQCYRQARVVPTPCRRAARGGSPRPLRSRGARGRIGACPQQRAASDDLLEARARFVARGVATPRLVVARAEGAQVEAADGTVYLDFAGGIACQNTGHGFAPVVAAIHEQVDRYLHQCFMVGTYEPYVEVCRRLAEHSPCAGESKSILVNSGAEAIENAVKIARAATGRPAVVVFEHGFHGRTLLTMAMTSKVRPYKAGFGPVPRRGLPRRRAVPLSRRRHRRGDRVARAPLQERRRGGDGRVRRARDGAGRGRLHPDADRLSGAAARALRPARDPLRRRRGAVRRRADRPDVGDRAQRRRAGPARLREVARRRPAAGGGDRARRGDGRARPGRTRRHFRRQPGRVRGRGRRPRHGRRAGVPGPRGRARDGRCARGSTSSPGVTTRSARCAGSDRCSRSS